MFIAIVMHLRPRWKIPMHFEKRPTRWFHYVWAKDASGIQCKSAITTGVRFQMTLHENAFERVPLIAGNFVLGRDELNTAPWPTELSLCWLQLLATITAEDRCPHTKGNTILLQNALFDKNYTLSWKPRKGLR